MRLNSYLDIAVKAVLVVAVVVLFVFVIDLQKSVAYVDIQKLVANYKGVAEAKTEFDSKMIVWQASLDTLRREVEIKIDEYQSTGSKLSTHEKQLMEELIQSKQQQFESYQQVVKDNITKADQEMTRRVLDKVNDYIQRYGHEKGFKIIFAATQYGNIVYGEKGYDVTEEVVAGLNAEYK